MKSETKELLLQAWQYCDEEDKSTEFMLQYMQDVVNVDLDCVISFLEKVDTIEVEKWREKNPLTPTNNQ